jgi:hypothetical protein
MSVIVDSSVKGNVDQQYDESHFESDKAEDYLEAFRYSWSVLAS